MLLSMIVFAALHDTLLHAGVASRPSFRVAGGVLQWSATSQEVMPNADRKTLLNILSGAAHRTGLC